MGTAKKRRIKRVSGQTGYAEMGPIVLSKRGALWLRHSLSVKRYTDFDFDEQVHWCISGPTVTVCLDEHEAVALRGLLPETVAGGAIETIEEDSE